MDCKFFNKMPFPVSLRKTWLEGAPAVKLKAGEQIEGPEKILAQYAFLAPAPLQFHKIESTTQSQNFEFRDELTPDNQLSPTDPVIITPPRRPPGVVERTPTYDGAVYHKPPEPEPDIKRVDIDMALLPFNPKAEGFNWMSVKTEDLKKAAEILNINLSSIMTKSLKDQKWEMIRFIKKALGLTSGN